MSRILRGALMVNFWFQTTVFRFTDEAPGSHWRKVMWLINADVSRALCLWTDTTGRTLVVKTGGLARSDQA